jgi:hypothetical protein
MSLACGKLALSTEIRDVIEFTIRVVEMFRAIRGLHYVVDIP